MGGRLLAHAAQPFPAHKVDGRGAVALASAPTNGTDHVPGETIRMTATLARAVTVDAALGAPTIALQVGRETRTIAWDADTSTPAELVFPYAVTAHHVDANGVSVPEKSLAAGAGAIVYADGSGPVLLHAALSAHVGAQRRCASADPTSRSLTLIRCPSSRDAALPKSLHVIRLAHSHLHSPSAVLLYTFTVAFAILAPHSPVGRSNDRNSRSYAAGEVNVPPALTNIRRNSVGAR